MIYPANVERVCEFRKSVPGAFTDLLGRKYRPGFLRIPPPFVIAEVSSEIIRPNRLPGKTATGRNRLFLRRFCGFFCFQRFLLFNDGTQFR
jgi:hypothetical protein